MTTPRAAPRVLVVDDAPRIRDFFNRLLTRSGMSVAFADDGLVGFAQARAWLPDVIVSDLDMPNLDGFELCRALRGDPATRDVPILIVSGSAMTDSQAALEAGCDAVLAKPCPPALLVGTIRRLLTLPSSGRRRVMAHDTHAHESRGAPEHHGVG